MPVAAETKFCTAQCQHLRQVAHGGFATVALPVGVGREADCRVERRVGRVRRETLRVQRQAVLQSQDQIHERKAEDIEQHGRDGVALP